MEYDDQPSLPIVTSVYGDICLSIPSLPTLFGYVFPQVQYGIYELQGHLFQTSSAIWNTCPYSTSVSYHTRIRQFAISFDCFRLKLQIVDLHSVECKCLCKKRPNPGYSITRDIAYKPLFGSMRHQWHDCISRKRPPVLIKRVPLHLLQWCYTNNFEVLEYFLMLIFIWHFDHRKSLGISLLSLRKYMRLLKVWCKLKEILQAAQWSSDWTDTVLIFSIEVEGLFLLTLSFAAIFTIGTKCMLPSRRVTCKVVQLYQILLLSYPCFFSFWKSIFVIIFLDHVRVL